MGVDKRIATAGSFTHVTRPTRQQMEYLLGNMQL